MIMSTHEMTTEQIQPTKHLIATKARHVAKFFSQPVGNLETGKFYSSRFMQETAKITLLLRQMWKPLAFTTACLMLLVVYPAAMTAIRRRLTDKEAVKTLMENETFTKEFNAVLNESQHSTHPMQKPLYRRRLASHKYSKGATVFWRKSEYYIKELLHAVDGKCQYKIKKKHNNPDNKWKIGSVYESELTENDGGWSAQSSSSDSSGLEEDLDGEAARAFFTDQLTLKAKDIEFDNSQARAAFVEETVKLIMRVFQRKNSESPVVPFKFWKESQDWMERNLPNLIKIANKKAKPETGGTALEMMGKLNIPEMKR